MVNITEPYTVQLGEAKGEKWYCIRLSCNAEAIGRRINGIFIPFV